MWKVVFFSFIIGICSFGVYLFIIYMRQEKQRIEKQNEKIELLKKNKKKYKAFEKGIHYQKIFLEKGYKCNEIAGGRFFKNKLELRTDFRPIDIRTEKMVGFSGELVETKNSVIKQKLIKTVLMQIYPDRYFIDDLKEWNTYCPTNIFSNSVRNIAEKEATLREQQDDFRTDYYYYDCNDYNYDSDKEDCDCGEDYGEDCREDCECDCHDS